MVRALTGMAVVFAISGPLAAQDVAAVAGKRVVFLALICSTAARRAPPSALPHKFPVRAAALV